MMYRKGFKRFFDVVFSLIGLLILSPVLLTLLIIVRVKLGSPAIFRQERPGRGGRIFKLYKFRSMTEIRDESGELLPDNERLTSFGKMLRATSLDELPELWNILRGDMSVVGPRPLLVQYLPLYSAEQMRRHDVRPGLTGHAQVNGRNAISWPDKFRLDCWYVDNLGFWLDVRIIFSTFAKVVSRSGISSSTSDTMEFFTGND
jgi:lipopolysaccharide/colanic/teichoic acid biosynthesis glycosyltransferase